MSIERGPRGPIIPGAPDRDLTNLVNQVLQEGPDILDIDWLDEVPLDSRDAQDMFLFFDGKTAINVLQGAVLSPLFDRVLQTAPSRRPFGLVYDASRNLRHERRYRTYQVVDSFSREKWGRSVLEDPYDLLMYSLNDTLELSLSMHLSALRDKKERGLKEPLVKSLRRLEQFDVIAKTIDPDGASPIQQLEGGIGSGSTVTAAVSKVIPLLLEKHGITDMKETNSVTIAAAVAENTLATITNLALLDNHSFTDIVPSWFSPILKNFTPDLLDRFTLIELKTKGFAVDLSDEARKGVTEKYMQSKVPYIPRTGCPLRAIVSHERNGKNISAAGVVDLWKFASPARLAIYTQQHEIGRLAA